MTEVEKMYDKFFGKGLWEQQYKRHIVAFTNICIKVSFEDEKRKLTSNSKDEIIKIINSLDRLENQFDKGNLTKDDFVIKISDTIYKFKKSMSTKP